MQLLGCCRWVTAGEVHWWPCPLLSLPWSGLISVQTDRDVVRDVLYRDPLWAHHDHWSQSDRVVGFQAGDSWFFFVIADRMMEVLSLTGTVESCMFQMLRKNTSQMVWHTISEHTSTLSGPAALLMFSWGIPLGAAGGEAQLHLGVKGRVWSWLISWSLVAC